MENQVHQGEQLRQFLRIRSLNISDVAEKLDISRGTIYLWFDKQVLPLDTLALLKQKIGFDYTLVNTGVLRVNEPIAPYRSGNIIHVPIHAFGGFLAGYENEIYADSLERYSLPGVHGRHFSFEVEGMSMYKKDDERSMKPGDWVITQQIDNPEWMSKGKVYVLVTIDGIIVKVFDKIEGNKVHLHSLNEDYDGHTLPVKNLKKAYFVSQILKRT